MLPARPAPGQGRLIGHQYFIGVRGSGYQPRAKPEGTAMPAAHPGDSPREPSTAVAAWAQTPPLPECGESSTVYNPNPFQACHTPSLSHSDTPQNQTYTVQRQPHTQNSKHTPHPAHKPLRALRQAADMHTKKHNTCVTDTYYLEVQ
jgi:hypothetical protein